MPADPESQPELEPDRLEVATDQAIAACGGNARDAVKALIVANEFMESEVCELMHAVSHAYAREDLRPIPADRGGRASAHCNGGSIGGAQGIEPWTSPV